MAGFTEDQFMALVKKSERDAANDIAAYKIKLALFAMLGYVVIFGVLAALILVVGGTIGLAFVSSSLFLLLIKKKFILAILFAIWTFLRALWVKFEAPTGYVLKRKQFPELFVEIDSLTHKLDALKIHQVIIHDDLNAGVVQHPRLGLLGWHQNTLFLGLQLLLALPPEEARAVLAHELGHLSGNHSHFSGWIYRVRITWSRVMASFDSSDSFGARMMRRFFDWYAPTFSAYSFALARSNEYEADRIAAELTSPRVAASALVNVHTKAPYIDQQFWDAYFSKADEMPQPPGPPFERLATFLKQSPISRDSMLSLIRQNMQIETHYADTHPALKDRLAEITSESVLPAAFDVNAAESWFASKYQTILAHFDKAWLDANAERWKSRYDYVQQAQALLNSSVGVDPDGMEDDHLWDLAVKTREFSGDEAALPLFERYQQRYPDAIGAAYYIGFILAKQRDARALDQLRRALESRHTIGDVAHCGYDLLKSLGRDEDAERWWQDALSVQERHRAIEHERSFVALENSYESPAIDAVVLALLKQRLLAQKTVGAAWLAQKVLSRPDPEPVYIVAIEPKGVVWSNGRFTKTIAQLLQLNVDMFVVCTRGDTRKLAAKVKKSGIRIL